MPEILLHCQGISKTYYQQVMPSQMLQDRIIKWKSQRQKIEIRALQDISFRVGRGVWLGIYGPNGSGKTTLLQILAGLLPQDTGEVKRKGKMSCFFTLGVGFHDEKCARENIFLHGLLHGMHSKEINEMSDKIIEFAEIDSHIDLPLKCYSTGMRARLAYAAAAYIDSDIYLFDEIMAVGDERFKNKCMEHMESLRKQDKSVVIVSHSEQSLEKFCDRIIYIEKGKKIKIRKDGEDYTRGGEEAVSTTKSPKKKRK